jgi:hypothetical protein
MSSFSVYVTEDRRLCILRALAAETSSTLNESILQRAAEGYGHNVSRDVIKQDLRWLSEVGAIALREVQTYLIATLSDRGLDHVERRTAIDGIARPKPGVL